MIQNTELIGRIVLATVCGSFIGYERTNRNKGAGIRTHAIVALASAVMMIVSKYGFYDIDNYDASRVAAQIVSGVGFLGAGLIFVRNNNVISGLTTAAGVWGTAGVGMAIGAGQYIIGIFTTILVVFIQIFLHKETFFTRGEGYRYKLYLKLLNIDTYTQIKPKILSEMQIEGLNIKKNRDGTVDVELDILIKDSYRRFRALEDVMLNKNVIDGYWE